MEKKKLWSFFPPAPYSFYSGPSTRTQEKPVTEMGSLSIGSWMEEKDSYLLKWICHWWRKFLAPTEFILSQTFLSLNIANEQIYSLWICRLHANSGDRYFPAQILWLHPGRGVKTITNDKMTSHCVVLRETSVSKKDSIQHPEVQVHNDLHWEPFYNMGNRNKTKILSNSSTAPGTDTPNHTPLTGDFSQSSLLLQQRTLQLYVHCFLTRTDAYRSWGTYLSWINFFPINFIGIMGLCSCSRREQGLYFFCSTLISSNLQN